jgi:ATP-binding cassette subfamily C protein LapB
LFLGIVWYLAGPLVLVPVAALLLFAVAAWALASRVRSALRERAVLDERRYNFLLEVLGGAHTVKALAIEALMLRRYERLLGTGAAATYRVALPGGLAQSLGGMLSQALMALAVGAGAWLVAREQLTVAGLAACTLLVGRSIQPLPRAMGLWTRLQRARLARQRLLEVLELPKTAPRPILCREPFAMAIELQDIRFRYGQGGAELINGSVCRSHRAKR